MRKHAHNKQAAQAHEKECAHRARANTLSRPHALQYHHLGRPAAPPQNQRLFLCCCSFQGIRKPQNQRFCWLSLSCCAICACAGCVARARVCVSVARARGKAAGREFPRRSASSRQAGRRPRRQQAHSATRRRGVHVKSAGAGKG